MDMDDFDAMQEQVLWPELDVMPWEPDHDPEEWDEEWEDEDYGPNLPEFSEPEDEWLDSYMEDRIGSVQDGTCDFDYEGWGY
jgi:hypothetical protein